MKTNSNLEYKLKQLEANTEYKCFILKFCSEMAKHFLEQGDKEMALNVMVRASEYNTSISDTFLANALSKVSSNNKDIQYKFNLEEALKQLEDTTVHKCFVHKSCSKMAKYFLEQGNENMALNIVLRASKHDISKFKNEEFDALSKISNDMSCMQDAGKALDKVKEDAIKLHWKNNLHHPEYWSCYADMDELDIIEMVCDWHSRSVQFGTDLISFVNIRQEDRFKFPSDMYDKIIFYCNILLR